MPNKNQTKPGHGADVAEPTPNCRHASKWVAILNDRLLPMPRQVVQAKDIKHEAGIGTGFTLLRDHNSPHDVMFVDDETVDLALGNVFRVIPACEAAPTQPCREPAKLAFSMDDAWKLTINPDHTCESLRHLFGLSDDVELFRDFMSPQDEPVCDTDRIRFADGPVFRAERRKVTVKVNKNEVTFAKRRVTGAEIKTTAAKQGVTIPEHGVLYAMTPAGQKPIPDQETVTLKECDEFRCVTADDNS